MCICEMLIPLNPDASQLASYCALGFIIVMSVLFVQSLLTSLIGKVFSMVDKMKNNQQ